MHICVSRIIINWIWNNFQKFSKEILQDYDKYPSWKYGLFSNNFKWISMTKKIFLQNIMNEISISFAIVKFNRQYIANIISREIEIIKLIIWRHKKIYDWYFNWYLQSLEEKARKYKVFWIWITLSNSLFMKRWDWRHDAPLLQ